jgi:hypothetical protein
MEVILQSWVVRVVASEMGTPSKLAGWQAVHDEFVVSVHYGHNATVCCFVVA